MNGEMKWIPESVQKVDDGLTLEWFREKSLVVYKLTSVSTQTLSLWTNVIVELLQSWPEDKPYCAIHDFSSRGVSLNYAVRMKHNVLNIGATPTGRDLIQDIFVKRPELFARVALVFSPTFSGNLGHTFARHDRPDLGHVNYKLFFDIEPAFQWLTDESHP